jgi:DNA-directed RNA polymerase sigma subunit (sigma70/sigma32)
METLTKDQELSLGRAIQRYKPIKDKYTRISEKSRKDRTLEETEFLESNRKLAVEALEAVNLLWDQYKNMAYKRAIELKKTTGSQLLLEDLQQDAQIGLMKAIWSFDPAKKCKLSTHAFSYIFKELQVKINEAKGLIRLPESAYGRLSEVIKAQRAYAEENPIQNEIDFIVEWCHKYSKYAKKIDSNEVILLLARSAPIASTNAPIGDNGEFGDLLAGEDLSTTTLFTHDVIKSLNEYEKNIIAFEFGFTPTVEYEEFCEMHNLNKGKMKKELDRILAKLRAKHKD